MDRSRWMEKQVKANKVFATLATFQRENGYPPTLRELVALEDIAMQTLCGILHYLLRIGSISQTRPHSPRCYFIPYEPNPWMDWEALQKKFRRENM